MSVKENVLKVLENRRDNFISGEDLAKNLGVSRNAVWKAVKSLQNEGYDINAVTNKGYCLLSNSDVISTMGIKKYLKNSENYDIKVYKTLSSTNTVAKEMASKGVKEGTVIVAEEQTAGRGRQGKTFYSPSKTGVYMSIILRPKITAEQSLNITTASAVAVCKVIEEVCNRPAKIKWVNDVYCDDKKVCGILTEASFGLESGYIEYVVLGIGINVKPPKNGFPDDINDIASYVTQIQTTDVRNKIIAKVIEYFWDYYLKLSEMTYFDEYRKRNILVGRDVYILKSDNKVQAKAIGIDENCGLIVENENGRQILTAGEVSIKLD